MKQYAVVSDLLSGDTFGYVVKSPGSTVCYGMSSKGHAWAHEFNSGETNSIFEGLPSGVEVGRFGPLTKSAENQLHAAKKSAISKLNEAPFYLYGVTEAYDYVEEGPKNISVKEAALVDIPDTRRYSAINFKALSFRADLGRTNFMAKARFHQAGIAYGSAGVNSKSLSESHFQISTGSTTYYRRAVADLVDAKGLVYDSRPSLQIEEKKLGRNLRRAGRFATARFDPNAIDGDEDGLVQEGTPFERPATPRAQVGEAAQTARRATTPGSREGFASGTSRDSDLRDSILRGMSSLNRRGRSEFVPDTPIEDRFDGEHVRAEIVDIGFLNYDLPEDSKVKFSVVGQMVDPNTGMVTDLYDPRDLTEDDTHFETIDDAMEFLENIEWHGDRGIGYREEGYLSAEGRRQKEFKERNGFASADKPRQKQAKEIADIMDDMVAYARENSGKKSSKYNMLQKVGSDSLEGDGTDVGRLVYGPEGFGIIVDARSFDYAGDGSFDVLYTHDGDGNRLDTPQMTTHDYEFAFMADTSDPAVQAPVFNDDMDILSFPDDDENFLERLEEQIDDPEKPFGMAALREQQRRERWRQSRREWLEQNERRREGFASGTTKRRVPVREGNLGTETQVREWEDAIDAAVESQRSQGLVGNIGNLVALREAIGEEYSESSGRTRKLLEALQSSPEFYEDERLQKLAEAINKLPRRLVNPEGPQRLSYSRFDRASGGRAFAKSRLKSRGITDPTDEEIKRFADAYEDLLAVNFSQANDSFGRSTTMEQVRDLLAAVENGDIDMPDVLDIVLKKKGMKRTPSERERKDALRALVQLDKYFEDESGWRAARNRREGVGSRTRAATTQRAATPRTTSREGFASGVTGRSGGAGTIRDAGRKSVDARDGQYAADLDDQQLADLKAAIEEKKAAIIKQIKTRQRKWSADFEDEMGEMTFNDEGQLVALDKMIQFIKNRVATSPDGPEKEKDIGNALRYQRYLDDLRTIKGMQDSKDFTRIEHLGSATRKNVVERAKAKNSSMPSLKNPADPSTVFGHADGFTKEEWDAEVREAKRAEGALGRLRQRAERRIFEWDDRRYSKRQQRRARRQGRSGAGSFGAEDDRGPGLIERGRRKARRAVRRALRSRKGEAGLLDNTVERDKVKAVSFDGDNPRLGDLKSMGEALRTLRRKDGGFKKASFTNTRGDKEDGVPTLRQNMEAAVIGQAQDMHATPALVGRSEFESLIEQGWEMIHRGFGRSGNDSRGINGARGWLDDPKRRISDGEGAQVQGAGEYWGKAYGQGRMNWRGFMHEGPVNVAVLVPPNARRVKIKDMDSNFRDLGKVNGVWKAAKSELGGDDAIRQVDKKELADKLRGLLDSSPAKDTALGKIYSQLIDKVAAGDDSAIDSLDMLASVAETPQMHGRNYLAAFMGYDVIDAESGVTLVLNRGAMVALDEPIPASEMNKLADASNEAIKKIGGTPTISDPMKGGSKGRGKKVRRGGEGADTPDNEAKVPEGTSADSAGTSTPTAKQISNMKVVPGPVGSNPAEWREDANGKKYLIKTPAKPEQADNEAAVATIYNLFGVGAPTGVIDDGGTRKPVITGLDLRNTVMTPQLQAEARKHMGLDMLLSNWDVRPGDNVVLDANGNLVRVDAGGGGMFRARGGDRTNFKPGGQWIEPASMLASGSFGQQLYGDVTNGDMVSAMKQVQGVDIAAVDAAMQKAGVSPEVRKIFRDVIQERKREAVRLEAQFAAAPANAKVVVDGTGSDARVAPGS